MANVASADVKNIDYAYEHFVDLSESLLFYCNPSCQNPARFLANTVAEIEAVYRERLKELDISCSLTVLASVEAAFRTDYLVRCRNKKRRKDVISRELRKIYELKKDRASLEEDILEVWKKNTIAPKHIIGDIIGALKLRHWIAHGRYWNQNLGRRYDFLTVHSLARIIINSFPLETM